MLATVLTWVYITIISYCTGYLFHQLIAKLTGTKNASEAHFSLKCLSGLFALTVVCSLLSLFMPLSLQSNLIILVVATLPVLFGLKSFRLSVQSDFDRLKKGNTLLSIFYVGFIAIIAYLCYTPSSHHDDGLYYSTSIKWLQEFGTVKGLANLNPRIGFNSSWHILQANFGFPFLGIGLLNDMNGLIFLHVLLYTFGGINALLKGSYSFSNALRAVLMMPILAFHFTASSDILVFNVNFLQAPTPDIPVCLVLWMVFLLFIESGNADSHPLTKWLVIIYATWALTIKLSSAPIVILLLAQAILLIRKKQLVPVLATTIMCGLLSLPWITRTYMITGYPFFPFSGIDIFNPDWKLPIQHVRWHENAIKAFPIGADLGKKFEQPLSEWFPGWFSNLSFISQVVFEFAVAGTLVFFLIAVWNLVRRNTGFFSVNIRHVVVVFTSIAGILFWLNKGPDFRFGYGFLLLFDLYFIITICTYFLDVHLRLIAYPVMLYSAAMLFGYYRTTWSPVRKHFFSSPLVYRLPETHDSTVTKKGLKINLVSRDDSWNLALPVANDYEYNAIVPEMLGNKFEEGFKGQN